MTAGRVVVVAVLAAVALAGCGGGGDKTPALDRLPLPTGSEIVSQVRQCNQGTNAYCAIEFVVVNKRIANSWGLVAKERRALAQRGWNATHANNGDEHAATSPGDKLRVTIVTPGFVATNFVDSVPDSHVRARLIASRDEFAIPPGTIARAIAFAIEQPPEVDVNEIVIRPTAQA